MYKLLVLLLLLTHCSLLNISASDFPDSIFPSDSGGSSDVPVDASIVLNSSTKDDTLDYVINISHASGIKEVIVSGSTFEGTTITPTEDTQVCISDEIALSYNNTYTRLKPVYNIYVELHPMEGDTVVSNFTVEAVIQDIQGIQTSWTDENLSLIVSDKGAGLDSITIPLTTNDKTTELIYSTTEDDRNSLIVPKSDMPQKLQNATSIDITVTSTGGTSMDYKISKTL